METNKRTLSKTEAKLILDLEWQGKKNITLSDLEEMLNVSSEYAAVFAHRLVEKAWLERLRPGVFRLIPAERGIDAISDTNPFLGEEVFGHPYFYSFGTACSYYGFTEQAFTEMYVACTKDRPSREFRDKRYVFILMSQPHFFGFESVTVLGEDVNMATKEKTILDALDRPQYAGGLGEVSRIIAKALPKLDWPQLFSCLKQWDESALIQRLGFFIDFHQIPMTAANREKLKKLIHAKSKIFLGSRKDWGTSGTLNPEWNIIENVPTEILKENNQGKRIMRFQRKKPS